MTSRFARQFSQISLTKRFAVVSFAILITGMLVIGWWVTKQIETGVLNRTASVTASFVNSALAPHLQELEYSDEISQHRLEALNELLTDSDLGQRIVSFKIWSTDGRILYSPEPGLVGRTFPIESNLRLALEGKIVSQVSDLSEDENVYERQRFSRLQETYTPLRVLGSGEIIGVVEFYEGTGELVAEIQSARIRTWLVISGATLAMYLLLVGMVKGASITIIQQRRQLEERVADLDHAVSQNQALNRHLAALAAVATTANETPDLETMLTRCLEVTLEQRDMEAGVITLNDGLDKRVSVASKGRQLSGFPCVGQISDIGERSIVDAVTRGSQINHGTTNNWQLRPPCGLSQTHALAILPLKSRKDVIGTLSLTRHQGEALSSEERETLEAIAGRIGTAVENIRLMDELGRLETQRELDRIKTEFISAVSHELRTPLGIIKGYATTLLRDDIEVDQTDRREFLQIIDEESDRLQRMVDDLLDASRIQAGRLQLDLITVHLNSFLQAAVGKVAANLSLREQSVEVRKIRRDVDVLIDPGRIEQVLHNLLDNASRYSESGSIIFVGAEIREDDAVVSVTDDGQGIEADEIERIFEPFFRGVRAKERDAGGTGLGLPISRGIIEAHGGEIGVNSAPGKGSTFRFSLPLAKSPKSQIKESGDIPDA